MLDLSYFIGKSYFDDNGSQNYLIFKSVSKYFQIFSGIVNKILGWKSKGLSEESITIPTTSSSNFVAKLNYNRNSNMAVKLEGNSLKKDYLSSTYGNVVNFFIVYELFTH